MEDGNYKFADIEITKKDEKITLKNSPTLAGSVANMHKTFFTF